MYTGSRITDAVRYHHVRGELNRAVRVVRNRQPEVHRWREAIYRVNNGASHLKGLDRARIEEPVRETVMDLRDRQLQYEVVLDADATGVDLDRGEILPTRSAGELRRMMFLTGISPNTLARYMPIPFDIEAPVKVAPVVRLSRKLADLHYRQAVDLYRWVPSSAVWMCDADIQQKARADRNMQQARAWQGLAHALLYAA